MLGFLESEIRKVKRDSALLESIYANQANRSMKS